MELTKIKYKMSETLLKLVDLLAIKL